MLAAQPLTTFCEAVASREPTPGGGAVAAAVGALGAAVGLMAARYSEGHEAAAGSADRLADEIAGLDELRRRLLELLDDDAEAYAAVGAAYALPRHDAEAKAVRRMAIQDALTRAAEPPLRMCRAALEGLALLDTLRTHANPNLLSDVGVAAWALGAALRSAWLNVLVNLRPMKRADLVAALSAEGRELLDAGAELEARVGQHVLGALAV